MRQYQVTIKVCDTEARHDYIIYEDSNDILTAIGKAFDTTVDFCVDHPRQDSGITVVSNGEITYIEND